MNKKSVLMAGAGMAASFVALGGGFVAGRETAPKAETNGTNIEAIITGYNEGCAAVILDAAGLEFVVIANDPNTPDDEEFDSGQKAAAESEPFIKREMNACMVAQLPEGLTGYEIQYPEFTPKAAVITSTEG